MKALIDTNILYYREDTRVITTEIARLFKILHENKIAIVVHPASKTDISKDKNKERQKISQSKLLAYPLIQNPPEPTKNFLDLFHVKNSNDKIDVALLYALKANVVDFLITEDLGLHKNALKVGLGDRVFIMSEALLYLQSLYPEKAIYSPPAIYEDFVYNIDIADSIFDKLKADYQGFEKWWQKISKEGRKAWLCKNSLGQLGALLIYKIENEAITTTPVLKKAKRIKISTFIVTQNGMRIGESFIRLALEYTIQQKLSEVYLTHFVENQDRLIDLIQLYGFFEYGTFESGEKLYLKRIFQTDNGEFTLDHKPNEYYPCFKTSGVSKFMIPIVPMYHKRLFPGYEKKRQAQSIIQQLPFPETLIAESNTIKKAYLCHSNTTKLKPGDIIVFYRSQDSHSLVNLGVVENVYYKQTDVETIQRIVGNRSVYSAQEIIQLAKKETLVIIFQWHLDFKNNVTLVNMTKLDIPVPQSVTELSNSQFGYICETGVISEYIIID